MTTDSPTGSQPDPKARSGRRKFSKKRIFDPPPKAVQLPIIILKKDLPHHTLKNLMVLRAFHSCKIG
jgi:hypothetical protein